VELIRNDVSEEYIAYIFRQMEATRSSKMSVVTRLHIPEEVILRSHSRENLKSYIALTDWGL
jgi:hypothetical protein